MPGMWDTWEGDRASEYRETLELGLPTFPAGYPEKSVLVPERKADLCACRTGAVGSLREGVEFPMHRRKR